MRAWIWLVRWGHFSVWDIGGMMCTFPRKWIQQYSYAWHGSTNCRKKNANVFRLCYEKWKKTCDNVLISSANATWGRIHRIFSEESALGRWPSKSKRRFPHSGPMETRMQPEYNPSAFVWLVFSSVPLRWFQPHRWSSK